MNQAAAISAVYRALAHFRRRQAHNPSDHSAREIAQVSMPAEYLHKTDNPSRPGYETDRLKAQSQPVWDISQTKLLLQPTPAA